MNFSWDQIIEENRFYIERFSDNHFVTRSELTSGQLEVKRYILDTHSKNIFSIPNKRLLGSLTYTCDVYALYIECGLKINGELRYDTK